MLGKSSNYRLVSVNWLSAVRDWGCQHTLRKCASARTLNEGVPGCLRPRCIEISISRVANLLAKFRNTYQPDRTLVQVLLLLGITVGLSPEQSCAPGKYARNRRMNGIQRPSSQEWSD